MIATLSLYQIFEHQEGLHQEDFDVLAWENDGKETTKSYLWCSKNRVCTNGAMEQFGCQYHTFMNYFLRPILSICIHVKTLYELYTQSVLFDYVAAKYLEKRKYLQGLPGTLKTFEQEGRLDILGTVRTFGSLYHDGYSMVIWKPVEEKI
jgi:hypothetical protein